MFSLKLIALSLLALAAAHPPAKRLTCAESYTPCDGNVCADLQSDPNHCGHCWIKCMDTANNHTCQGGKCICPPGLTSCGPWNEWCVDTLTSRSHCGGCDQWCEGECVGGKCTGCLPGYAPCGGVCVRISTAKNCGACGASCGEGEICIAADWDRAEYCKKCPPGQGACDTHCVNFQNDNTGCGGCGIVCKEGNNCVNGKCVGGPGGCPPDQAKCGDDCVNTKNDNRHCGGCGRVCGAGKNCVRGKCK